MTRNEAIEKLESKLNEVNTNAILSEERKQICASTIIDNIELYKSAYPDNTEVRDILVSQTYAIVDNMIGIYKNNLEIEQMIMSLVDRR